MVLMDKMQTRETTFDLEAYLLNQQSKVEVALDNALPIIYPEKIYEAMRYSLLAGGKRLRPVLCIATCELIGGTLQTALPTACALEMIHTMSLIHDDLPAMDNDDIRRGKPTNHKVFGEDIAILAGDGLLAYAFEFIATQTQGAPAERLVQVIAKLGHAVGAAGLVGGQVLDLDSEGKPNISLDTLNFIHTHKTGALLDASVVCGGLLAGATSSDVKRLSRYAQNIGLAFQIIDDILDITASSDILGKTVGKDLKCQKVTYPSILGLDESRRQAQQLILSAKQELAVFGEGAMPLLAIADYIASRDH
jgi:geranylgeranyl diphosphate synthase, type II